MTEDKTNLDSVFLKIQKLLELQKGAEAVGSLQEASNAAGQIQKILMKHNLELSQVQERTNSKKVEVKPYEHNIYKLFDHREGQWLIKLYHHVSHLNSCMLMNIVPNNPNAEKTTLIIGKAHQVKVVIFLCLQLETKIRALYKESWKNYRGPEKKGTYRRGFFDGATYAVINKMMIAKEELIREESDSNTGNTRIGSSLPMIIKKDEADLALFKQQNFPNANQKNVGKELSSQDGKIEGVRRGREIELHQGLESSTNNKGLR